MLNTKMREELFDRCAVRDLGAFFGAAGYFTQTAEIQDLYLDRHAMAILSRNPHRNGRTANAIGW